jgi:hypothetical protein
METKFYIAFTLKTYKGTERFGKFFIGNNQERANEIFNKLEGSDEVDEGNMLSIEFMETREDLPLNLKVIACTLDQLAENCKLITKELFKSENLLS